MPLDVSSKAGQLSGAEQQLCSSAPPDLNHTSRILSTRASDANCVVIVLMFCLTVLKNIHIYIYLADEPISF